MTAAEVHAETWEPPRCSHGHIILGCPHDDCPEQTAYLARQQSALDQHHAHQQQEARRLVRGLLGLPLPEAVES